MRYIYTLLFLFCTLFVDAQGYESYSTTCFSSPSPLYKGMEQGNTPQGYKQTIYWKKHKKLKRYAYSTLGLCICSTIVGWIGEIGNHADTNSNWKEDGKAWDIVLAAGIGLTISSIPLFVVSHKNKKKAKESMNVSLKSSTIYLDLPHGMKQTQHAVGICINF